MRCIATIKEVADYAGVSVATISRALNNPERVREETRYKVFEAIEKLNYSPNVLGRNLRVARTKIILVLLPTIANDFYSTIISGIRSEAEKDGYNIMIGVTDNDPDLELRYMNLLQTKSVDGAILLSPIVKGELLSQIAREYPMVQCCEYLDGVDINTVTIDNYKAAYEATSYLIELGHKRIGFIGGQESYISAKLRAEGFRRALKENGLKIPNDYIHRSNYSYKSGGEACRKLLALEFPPTAIFTVADSIAVGAIKAAQEMGLEIGKHLDVMGFDDNSIARVYSPTITTVSQPRVELGQVAYRLLKEKISSLQSKTKKIELVHTLKIRETTKKRG